MGVALGRAAMGGPARMTDPRVSRQGFGQKPAFEVPELAFGTAAIEMAVLDGGDAGTIVAAILETTKRVHEIVRDGLGAQNANNATHLFRPLPCHRLHAALAGETPVEQIKQYFAS